MFRMKSEISAGRYLMIAVVIAHLIISAMILSNTKQFPGYAKSNLLTPSARSMSVYKPYKYNRSILVGLIEIEHCGGSAFYKLFTLYSSVRFVDPDNCEDHGAFKSLACEEIWDFGLRQRFLRLVHKHKAVTLFVSKFLLAVLKNPGVNIVRDNLCWTNVKSLKKVMQLKPDKVLVLVCDPIYRLFNAYHKQQHKPAESFFEYVRSQTEVLQNFKETLTLKRGKEKSLKDSTIQSDEHWGPAAIIVHGLYAYRLQTLLTAFDRKDLLFLAREDLQFDPGKVLAKIEDFFGLQHLSGLSDFYRNATSGIHCINHINEDIVCLDQVVLKQPNPVEVEAARKYYFKQNKLFFDKIGESFDWI